LNIRQKLPGQPGDIFINGGYPIAELNKGFVSPVFFFKALNMKPFHILEMQYKILKKNVKEISIKKQKNCLLFECFVYRMPSVMKLYRRKNV
jgi:hypothetical protein